MEFHCEPFVVGGLSAMFASCCNHPLDLAKVRLQLFSTINPAVPFKYQPNFVRVLYDMINKEGIRSLYSGLSAALLRQSVYGTSRLGLHRTFSDEMQRRNDHQPISFTLKMLSGVASGVIAVCLGTPCDVALVRMESDSMAAVHQRKGYRNVFHAMYRIVREEGVRALYSGLVPSILCGIATNVSMMACYDHAKEAIEDSRHEPRSQHGTRSTQMMAAALATVTTTVFTLPFDQIKSRLQHDRSNYKGVADVVRHIIRKEGVRSFWTGYQAYYIRSAPHAMIVLLCMDPLRRAYSELFGTKIIPYEL